MLLKRRAVTAAFLMGLSSAVLAAEYEWNGRDWKKVPAFRGEVPFRSGFGITFNLK